MKRKMYILIGIFALAILGIFYLWNAKSYEVTLVDSEEFENLMNTEDVFVINVHTPYMGEIEGTDLVAENWRDMSSYSDKLPEDKNAKILVYCRSGGMSWNASRQLAKMGYRNVYDLKGGMREWVASGKSLVFKK